MKFIRVQSVGVSDYLITKGKTNTPPSSLSLAILILSKSDLKSMTSLFYEIWSLPQILAVLIVLITVTKQNLRCHKRTAEELNLSFSKHLWWLIKLLSLLYFKGTEELI